MKKNLTLFAVAILSLGLTSCGTTTTSTSTETSNIVTSEVSSEVASSEEVNVTLTDDREELYTAVYGAYEDGTFQSYNEDENFKSFYEAVSSCFYNGEYGSYIHSTADTEKAPLYVKRADKNNEYSEETPLDQWYWLNADMELDGYYGFLTGFTDLYLQESYSSIYSTKDNFSPTYQPYSLIGKKEGHSNVTAAWNLEPYLDSRVIYNPLAFSGIQDTTYKFDLTESAIRPSYRDTQKALPELFLSTTDSYNSSKQGVYMDTNNGNWYYFYGESQSQSKLYMYDTSEVILTSTWNETTQEYTPDGDITLNLSTNYDAEYEVVNNTMTIDVLKEGVTTSFDREYEYVNMTSCGTHRANVGLDLIPTDDDEDLVLPDYMCGSYFDNVVISEATGTVREGLDVIEYGQTLGCEAGTYDLLNSTAASEARYETILDGSANISYDLSNPGKDIYNISYEQKDSASSRTSAIDACEVSLDKIADNDTATSASVLIAKSSYDKLSLQQKNVIKQIDNYSALIMRVGLE